MSTPETTQKPEKSIFLVFVCQIDLLTKVDRVSFQGRTPQAETIAKTHLLIRER
jgi:hypothetical protein